MSSYLHFCAPSLDLHSLVVKAIDFKRDELLVRCNLSGIESDGHFHGPSWAKDARWAAHLQVRGAGEQAAQAGGKHEEKQRCHKAACAPQETSGLLGALPSPLTASSGQEGPSCSLPGCVILAQGLLVLSGGKWDDLVPYVTGTPRRGE